VPHTFQIKVAFAQLMSAIRSLQQEVSIIAERVKQCQIDIQECLSYHHPKHDDDEDWEFNFYFFTLFICSYFAIDVI
jgi:hypothetical protein